MTLPDAMRRALRHAASVLEGDIASGAGWIFDGDDGQPLNDADRKRMEWAVTELAYRLRLRAEGRSP